MHYIGFYDLFKTVNGSNVLASELIESSLRNSNLDWDYDVERTTTYRGVFKLKVDPDLEEKNLYKFFSRLEIYQTATLEWVPYSGDVIKVPILIYYIKLGKVQLLESGETPDEKPDFWMFPKKLPESES